MSTKESIVFGSNVQYSNHMLQYDYRNQAWLENGRYIPCGHGAECQECFGTVHQGEQPKNSGDIE